MQPSSQPPITANYLKEVLNILDWKPTEWQRRCDICDSFLTMIMMVSPLPYMRITPGMSVNKKGNSLLLGGIRATYKCRRLNFGETCC
ncbi:hypothetical protein BDBG_16698 [Blastomyces gilchristii SLH14081]|uniref:Uncharacterized protein n=1 Tax=Blastomyces gilchristii (strain SLH14081) TaxID=559298 RepID=A0A179UFN6_BLAGS|nr:uncharacterized protein BDBG_16698 [Blastomyces gilchristii SLH14081]OAT06794.1 hypothetical protein BDBG_16698 [Blastomyces gilchristii SLH14081]